MLHFRDASVSNKVYCQHTDLIRFSEYFKINITDLPRLLKAIDEWWFVPRSAEAIQQSRKRIDEALHQYTTSHCVPHYISKAASYIDSERYEQIVSLIRAHNPQATAL